MLTSKRAQVDGDNSQHGICIIILSCFAHFYTHCPASHPVCLVFLCNALLPTASYWTFCNTEYLTVSVCSVAGHKAFCQFREKCMCKGCALIRLSQQVSKSQVRLRRQKDMEVDMVQLSPSQVEEHQQTPGESTNSCECRYMKGITA